VRIFLLALAMRRAKKGKKLLFIIHGARADQPALQHLVEWVREKGHVVDPRLTWEQGDGIRFTREGIERGVDAVVALGGDGTVNEVLNGLDGSDVPLGIVPIGTANDFARQVGIPDDVDHAMDVILQRKPARIDTAELDGRRFLNVSSGGVGAEATAETPAEAKESLGALAYAVTGVRKLPNLTPAHALFEGPGFSLETDYFVFGVANARSTGGGTLIAPRARVNDGLLDVCIVEAMPLRTFSRLLLKLRKGEHLDEEGVHYVQLPRLTISGREPATVNVDGETIVSDSLHYRVRPRDLLVHIPHLPGVEPK
jgi:lipid kinase YegS